jgi:hypothetical protein
VTKTWNTLMRNSFHKTRLLAPTWHSQRLQTSIATLSDDKSMHLSISREPSTLLTKRHWSQLTWLCSTVVSCVTVTSLPTKTCDCSVLFVNCQSTKTVSVKKVRIWSMKWTTTACWKLFGLAWFALCSRKAFRTLILSAATASSLVDWCTQQTASWRMLS